jgi:hypothetical protein
MVEGVIDILITDSTVQTLVGENLAGDKYKVYPVMVPQSEKHPYITVRQTSKVREGKGCPYKGGVEVTSYAKSYDDVVALDDANIAALDGEGDVVLTNGGVDNYVMVADGDGLYSRSSTFEGTL